MIVTGTRGDDITWQSLRFGIEEGTEIHVTKKIPGGPVIIAKNELEIAIGRTIAASIDVAPRQVVNNDR
ncbi:MAG: ferrous iron transport protein A [Candidatus Melainabacteria bacterium]|nr:ferrous iron transport protein A [Candidatus Melainabacteria bacterium]